MRSRASTLDTLVDGSKDTISVDIMKDGYLSDSIEYIPVPWNIGVDETVKFAFRRQVQMDIKKDQQLRTIISNISEQYCSALMGSMRDIGVQTPTLMVDVGVQVCAEMIDGGGAGYKSLYGHKHSSDLVGRVEVKEQSVELVVYESSSESSASGLDGYLDLDISDGDKHESAWSVEAQFTSYGRSWHG